MGWRRIGESEEIARTGLDLRLLLLVHEMLRDLALVGFVELVDVELGVHCGSGCFGMELNK